VLRNRAKYEFRENLEKFKNNSSYSLLQTIKIFYDSLSFYRTLAPFLFPSKKDIPSCKSNATIIPYFLDLRNAEEK